MFVERGYGIYEEMASEDVHDQATTEADPHVSITVHTSPGKLPSLISWIDQAIYSRKESKTLYSHVEEDSNKQTPAEWRSLLLRPYTLFSAMIAVLALVFTAVALLIYSVSSHEHSYSAVVSDN